MNSGVGLHIHLRRSSEDPNLVTARLIKSWFRPLQPASSKELGQTSFLVTPGDPEAIVLSQALRELARCVEGSLYDL